MYYVNYHRHDSQQNQYSQDIPMVFHTWIGAKDLTSDNQGYVWTDGFTSFNYTAWNTNEPNNTAEKCV